MNNKNYLVKHLLDWFQMYRPELDMNQEKAEKFYEEIKEELLFVERNNDKELIVLFLDEYLENYYSKPINQICMEVIREDEFHQTTLALEEKGFLLDELKKIIQEFEKRNSDWYQSYEPEEILYDKELREKVRNFLREKNWNDFIE